MKNHIAITSCPEVANIILPKIKQHGMTVFNYYKIYFDGRVVRLSSDSAWTEHYFQNNYLNILAVPKSYLTKPLNYYIWQIEDCPKVLLDASLNFNTSNGISIAEKHPDYIEYFCFGTTLENRSIINNFYLSNLDVLRQYGHYFREQANSLLRKAEKNMLQVTNVDVCHADCRPVDIMHNSLAKLTHRQTDCARLLLQGLRYKQIANELNLSTRTIESYIEDIKDKLQCQNKTELIIKLTEVFRFNTFM